MEVKIEPTEIGKYADLETTKIEPNVQELGNENRPLLIPSNIKVEVEELSNIKCQQESFSGDLSNDCEVNANDFIIEKTDLDKLKEELDCVNFKTEKVECDSSIVKRENTCSSTGTELDGVYIKTEITEECDLPTTKSEDYIDEPCSSTQEEENGIQGETDKDKQYPCPICGKSFRGLKNHIRQRHGHKELNKLPGTTKLPSHFTHKGFQNLKNHTHESQGLAAVKPFKCEICLKQFLRKSQINSHLCNEICKKRFKCGICSKTFAKNCNLKDHRRYHTGEKPFKCEICSTGFTTKPCLQRHVHLHYHTGEKPFKCKICSKTFMQNGNLQRHLRKHTDEKPFKCQICFEQFTRNVHLENHTRTHIGKKPFKCKVCFRTFPRSANLQSHMRIHFEVGI